MINNRELTAVDFEGSQHAITGSTLKWRPSAYGVVIEDNRILLCPQRRGGYDLPGGGVEMHETFEQAVEREVKEETGIDVCANRIINVRENLVMLPTDNPDGQQAYRTILLYYLCTKIGGEISVDGFDDWEKKNADMAKWIEIDKLDNLTIASTIDFRNIIKEVIG